MPRALPTFAPRTHVTALPGWRAPAARRASLRDCSLIVPAAGQPAGLERLLDTLLSIPDPPGEVVVVDGSPGREIDEFLREWRARSPAPFALAYVESPPELTRRRNIGIDISSGDFLFFLDPDTIPLPGYFAETRRVFEVDRHRSVGAVAGVAVNDMNAPPPVFARLRRLLGLLPRLDPLVYHPSGVYLPPSCFNPFSGLRRVDIVPGSGAAWRRDVFSRRRFSCFFGAHAEGENVDMSLRAGASWTLLCCGSARLVRHDASPDSSAAYAGGRESVRNRYFIWKRHTARPARRHVVRFWLNLLADIAGLLARPWDLSAIRRAAGALAAIPACLSDPPGFVEPPVRNEYVLAAEGRRLAAHGD